MGSVVLNSVRKSYGDAQVIKDVSLTIPDGEFCVLVGPQRLRQVYAIAHDRRPGGDLRRGSAHQRA
ncbi:Maltose/maltodextrin import ATP-binding protein MalK [Raoultella planticola]|uniref:Maltose/maltodextrin import ATP-binding protein MalK n=1 Tax=Raoultella planticola TaxID=575 RepID=A0A485AQB8_RAOPL|nr:Maltose/maltodextrin import ATP-binding protein MalK [Raoultella planticola]